MITLKNWLLNKWIQLGLLFLVAILISIQKYFAPVNDFGWSGYNNFIIFKESFFHLINGEDIYKLFPQDHFDLFKYSPSFALLMFFLAPFPNLIGLMLWNSLNIFIFFLGVQKLPLKGKFATLFFLLFIIVELITSTQNSQSNALIAGMIMLAYYNLEKNKIVWATLLIVGTVYIKLFGIVAFALFLFYPNKIKSSLYTILWATLLALLPLVVISWPQLLDLYESWGSLLGNDHDTKVKFSVMGILNSWGGISVKYKASVLLVGVITFCIPLIKIKCYSLKRFKLLYLCSVLIWVIIFNHMAESATFIIAVTGIAIWFFSKENVSYIDISLLLLTIILTILSPTDLFPKSFRETILIPYTLKVLPCILIWLKINWEILNLKPSFNQVLENSP